MQSCLQLFRVCLCYTKQLRKEKKRDILIEDKSRNLYFGMELETESDYSMPERIMVYDACEYECQIREFRLYRAPVVCRLSANTFISVKYG